MNRAGTGLVIVSMCCFAQGQVDFSHDIGTVGAPGSGVNLAPNIGEVFSANGVSNILAADLVSLGLVFGDNIDAFDRGDVNFAGSGVSAFPFLFSVEPGANGEQPYPIWAQAPFNAADVYALQSGVTGHVLAYNEPGLGLLTAPIESIDGMTDSMVGPGQRVYFSLEQGSPTLLGNAWSGGDVLTVVIGVPGSLQRAISANDLGLIPADELDAFAMFGRTDVNGNGVFDDIADSALLYFSVDETSTGVIGSDVRMRSLTSPHHGGDIYFSGAFGNHVLLHAAEKRIRLGAGDVLDALKLGSSDQADPFPMFAPGDPNPGDEPEKPITCPPYRGTGVPIGTTWIEVCDQPVPNVVNWSIKIKMCDANGNVMEIDVAGPTIRGSASADPFVKAKMIKDAFESIEFPKPGHDPDSIPMFNNLVINVPPINVARPGISAEVCMFTNQDVIDCGWNIDDICFSFSNWTANIIVKPVKGWFPDVKRHPLMQATGFAEVDTILRVSTSDGPDEGATDVVYSVPVAAGMGGPEALVLLSEHINKKGGVTFVNADGVMTIVELPLEPPPDSEGLSGPFVWEAGAPGANTMQITVAANLVRGPGSPCSAVDYAEPFGQLNFFDVSAFLSRFTDGVGDADLQWDGDFNFFDVSTFLQLYTQGCPDTAG